MSPIEKRIYDLLANTRNAFLRPINIALTKIGVRADTISYLGVALMIGFILNVSTSPKTAFWFLVARVLADLMDGPLARYQKSASDRGKFVDVVMDNLGFVLFIIGVIKAGLIEGYLGAGFLFATELVVVLMIISFNLTHKSRWLFFASAGSFPYNFMYLGYIGFIYYAFGGTNHLQTIAQVSSVLLSLKAVEQFYKLQAIPDKNN